MKKKNKKQKTMHCSRLTVCEVVILTAPNMCIGCSEQALSRPDRCTPPFRILAGSAVAVIQAGSHQNF